MSGLRHYAEFHLKGTLAIHFIVQHRPEFAMPATAILVATAIVALGAGLAIGWTMGIRRKSKRDVIIDLENRLEKALESRADYEAEVAEHFAQTAQLLNRMTEDYRAVYNHLATGADKLCDGAVSIPPAMLTASSDDDAEIPASMINVVPPLDYAPRKSPDEQGQLSEAFGLDRTSAGSVLPPEKVAGGH